MPPIHDLKLGDPWYDLVRAKVKTFEGRRSTKTMLTVNLGDFFRFAHHTDPTRPAFWREVVSIHRFRSFEDALRLLPLEKVLPGVASVEEGVQVYLKYVSLKTQEEDGVIVFGLAEVVY